MRFSCQDLVAANKDILRALNLGVSEIHLYHEDNLSQEDLDIILEGVILDLVEVVLMRNNQFYDLKGQDQFFASDLFEENAVIEALAWDLFRAYDDFLRNGSYSPVFHLFSNSKYFETVAKFRAMRLCWKLINETQRESMKCRLVGHILFENDTDDNTNMIVGTNQTMAAVIGGADTIIISPADKNYDSAFAERIATNVNHLAVYESHLDKVADPAAGAYFIEDLTNHYAKEIWSGFQFQVKNPRPGSFQNP